MPAPSPLHVLLVALGGALGASARFAVGHLLARPWATLGVNLLGCLAIGALAALPLGAGWLAFAAVGLLGGFTTFSTFGLDAVALVEDGRPLTAALYVGASVGLGLLAVLAGRGLLRLALG